MQSQNRIQTTDGEVRTSHTATGKVRLETPKTSTEMTPDQARSLADNIRNAAESDSSER